MQYVFQVEGQEFTVEIINAVDDYVDLMKEIFDFDLLKRSKLPILINCMNGGKLRRHLSYWKKSSVCNIVPYCSNRSLC